MTKYFKNISYTKNSLKREYRKLAQLYHPDKGGKETDFVAMSKEYEALSQQLKNHTYTAEPIKTEPTYQNNNHQTNKKEAETKKPKKEPIKRAEPDFVFLRSMLKKVHIFSIKHPLICSNLIHTTNALIF
jgi:DnaJ-class molecular chaperone